jgi:hypothetical protein
MRFFIASLLKPPVPVSFATIERIVPDIYQNTLRDLRRMPRPRILKSHESFDPRYGKTLYIVRDPRDVAVSYCRYLQRIGVLPLGISWEQFVEYFVEGQLDTYGRWNDHVEGWLRHRSGHDDFLLVRYEDVLADALGALEKVAAFLSVRRERSELETIVADCSLKSMRAHEVRHENGMACQSGIVREIPFIGTGTHGRWESVLPPAASARIERAFGSTMRKMGYDLSKRPKSP